MKIVADTDLYQVETLFSHVGELVLLPGRGIRNHHLLDADALIVRSTTLVSEQLLKGTSLKFVASATSGTDHIDLDHLSAKGIAFADAKGSNANAVTDYCLAAIGEFQGKNELDHLKPKVGIIGNGMIGSRLAEKIRALGWNVLINDPPQSGVKSKD
jgi:erythronate-4-phosphate dehydrogenase